MEAAIVSANSLHRKISGGRDVRRGRRSGEGSHYRDSRAVELLRVEVEEALAA